MDTPALAASAPTFQAILSEGVTREHLPQLVRLLDHLSNESFSPDAFEFNFVFFANLYGKMLHYAGHLANGDPDDYSLDIARCERLFEVFLVYERKAHGCTNNPPPSFEELWDELQSTFQHIDGAVDSGHVYVCGTTTVLGRTVERWQAFTLEYLQHCGAAWTQVITSIFEKQPVYTDLPSNYDEYVSNRLAWDDPVFEMTAALQRFSEEDQCDKQSKERCIETLLMFFAGSAAFVADLFAATSYTPTSAQVNILSDTCARKWALDVGEGSMELWNVYPHVVRQHMTSVNARGVAEVLVHRCRNFLQYHPPRHLSWFLNVWLMQRVIAAFDGDSKKADWIEDLLRQWHALGDKDLLDNIFEAKDNYIPHYFRNYRLSRLDLEEANRLMSLQDVLFVPIGPPVDPLCYTDPILATTKKDLCVLCQYEFEDHATVKLRACNHIMHLECVRTLINGVENNSNLCPLDRESICPPRPRQPAP
jgi:hypothetical protein